MMFKKSRYNTHNLETHDQTTRDRKICLICLTLFIAIVKCLTAVLFNLFNTIVKCQVIIAVIIIISLYYNITDLYYNSFKFYTLANKDRAY